MQSIKKEKHHRKTTKPKWQTETQGKRNNGDTEQPVNKRLNGSTKPSLGSDHLKYK